MATVKNANNDVAHYVEARISTRVSSGGGGAGSTQPSDEWDPDDGTVTDLITKLLIHLKPEEGEG